MKGIKKLLVILGLIALSDSILGMQKENQITLVGNDGKQVKIARETAQKIPTIQSMLTFGLEEAETSSIKFELFDTAVLQSVVDIVEKVYTQAPVLKLDPQFFEQTDKHRTYTPADIPEQVRNIVIAQGLQENKIFMQAANFLGLDWVQTAVQDGKSVADLIVYNQLPLISDHILDLKNKNITSIVGLHLLSHDIIANLQALRISNNKLTSIPDKTFANFTNLQELYLDNNKITSITNNTFANLANLQYLMFTDNKITFIPDNSFADLHNLQVLLLVGNKITSISDNTFTGLNNLRDLGLSRNRLTSISNNAFSNLTRLRELWLRSNQLDQMTKNHIQQQLPNVRITF